MGLKYEDLKGTFEKIASSLTSSDDEIANRLGNVFEGIAPYIMAGMPNTELDEIIESFEIEHINIKNKCTSINLEEISNDIIVIYSYNDTHYIKRNGGKYENQFVEFDTNIGDYDTKIGVYEYSNYKLVPESKAKVIFTKPNSPDIVSYCDIVKFSNTKTKQSIRYAVKVVNKDFNYKPKFKNSKFEDSYLVRFVLNEIPIKSIYFSSSAIKKYITFLMYVSTDWANDIINNIKHECVINDGNIQMIPTLHPLNIKVFKLIQDNFYDDPDYNSLKWKPTLTIERSLLEAEMDNRLNKNELIEFCQVGVSSDDNSGILSSILLIPFYEYQKIDNRFEKHPFDKFNVDYKYVGQFFYDHEAIIFIIDDLEIPKFLKELHGADKHWIKNFKQQLEENGPYILNEKRQSKIDDIINMKDEEDEEDEEAVRKKKNDELIQTRLEQLKIDKQLKLELEADLAEFKHIIKTKYDKVWYRSTIRKIIVMVNASRETPYLISIADLMREKIRLRKLKNTNPVVPPVLAPIPTQFSPIYTVHPAAILPNPFTIPSHSPSSNDPNRIGTSRALTGVQNIMVIYPKGTEYPGRLKHTICGRVVIEPSEPDTAAFICWAKDIIGMTDIYLSDIDNVERIYHTEKGYAILNSLTYI